MEPEQSIASVCVGRGADRLSLDLPIIAEKRLKSPDNRRLWQTALRRPPRRAMTVARAPAGAGHGRRGTARHPQAGSRGLECLASRASNIRPDLAGPTSAGPTSAGPTSARANLSGANLSGANLGGANLAQGQPRRGQPQRGQPQRGQPRRGQPPRGQPPRGRPRRGRPQQGQPQRGRPQRGQPQRGRPRGASCTKRSWPIST